MEHYKIDITALLQKGLGEKVAFSFPLQKSHDKTITFSKTSELTGEITNLEDYLLIDFAINKYQLTQECVRCLTEIQQITSIDQVSESYSLTNKEENSFELLTEDPETHKRILDITPLVDQELELNRKDTVLCKKNCLGLCQYCGKDLNKSQCKCKLPSEHSPFDHLKQHFST